MNCSGSVALLKELLLPESDDPDYRREGTAMHEAAAYCLDNGLDTWEITGHTFNNTVIDDVMARAVQVYLDTVRPISDEAIKFYVEYPISSPVHPDFYGCADYGAWLPERIKVVDLKGGQGIIVEVEDNPQCKYYGFGFIDGIEREQGFEFDPEMPVDIGIVQPRGIGEDEKVRWWPTTVGEIKEWVHDTLVPAMCATEFDNSLNAGSWCRFCPAKLVCPLLTSLFRAACVANPKEIINLNDASLDRSYPYIEGVKFYLKALGEETMRRHMTGHEFTQSKLVRKRANRVYKPGAPELAMERFGDDAMTKPELKSPGQLEAVSPEAQEFVKEFAYIPETGYTVVGINDRGRPIKMEPGSKAFAAYLENPDV